MKCPVCSTGMVQARATSFGEEYWYCRACKKELAELNPKEADALGAAAAAAMAAVNSLDTTGVYPLFSGGLATPPTSAKKPKIVMTTYFAGQTFVQTDSAPCKGGSLTHKWYVNRDGCEDCALTTADLAL